MNITKFINKCIKFNHVLFQHRCVLCSAQAEQSYALCQACFNDLPWHNQTQCIQCATATNHILCGQCLKSPPAFDATHAALRYDFPLSALMQRYKYGDSLQLSRLFAQLMMTHKKMQAIDLIIPMPLHPTRLKERGFNQSLEIARCLAKQQHIALDYTSCTRTKFTPPQASLPLKDRVNNVRGVFSCNAHFPKLRIALIDDVMTTGASLNELAKTIKHAGASHVECWVVARTLPRP